MKLTHGLALAVLAVVLAGCGKSNQKADEPAAGAGDPGAATSGLGSEAGGGVTSEGAGEGEQTAQQQALAQLKSRSVIYFDYDSSEIRAEYVDVVAAHAAYLVKYPTARVRLEGHTDERGSREYNIGLGERRAQAVRRALQSQGAADAQIATVSYGEERPAAPGEDDAAYSQNRRVELAYAQ
jgi:peptidoglycan-associated lipoprotein